VPTVPYDLRIERGRLVAHSESARSLLDAGDGAYQILSGAPDLLLLLRERPAGLWATLQELRPGEAILAGDLSEVQPSELLNFLDQAKRTGVLLACSGETERGIVLLEGNVAWACSNHPGERLGEMLVRAGGVERSEVDEAVAEQGQLREKKPDAGQVRLGQLLERRRGIKPETMARALRHQVVEIFLGLLLLKSGSFLFLSGCDAKKLPADLGLDTEGLLLDGLRRLDEMEELRDKLPPLSVRLGPARKAVPKGTDGGRFSEEARLLLPHLDGKRTLAAAAAAAGLSEYEGTKAAFKLLDGGWAALLSESAKK
jgi:hypothetical protein